MATIVVPLIILWSSGVDIDLVPALFGGALVVGGIGLVAWTVKLFVTIGRGTLAPWDATTRLVVRGPYRHVRNPMITAVALILAGEAAVFGSVPLLIFLGIFVLVNAVYFPLVEEPGLSRRFGTEYERYKANVGRWLPRLRPWTPEG
jgi:protein-S-isoprenylcysteine O-methyltransferase Ste14